jgi:hypothetical protein
MMIEDCSLPGAVDRALAVIRDAVRAAGLGWKTDRSVVRAAPAENAGRLFAPAA